MADVRGLRKVVDRTETPDDVEDRGSAGEY